MRDTVRASYRPFLGPPFTTGRELQETTQWQEQRLYGKVHQCLHCNTAIGLCQAPFKIAAVHISVETHLALSFRVYPWRVPPLRPKKTSLRGGSAVCERRSNLPLISRRLLHFVRNDRFLGSGAKESPPLPGEIAFLARSGRNRVFVRGAIAWLAGQTMTWQMSAAE
jgi:hypothetical protein